MGGGAVGRLRAVQGVAADGAATRRLRVSTGRKTRRPATAPRPLGLGGRPRVHPDRTRARYNRTRVGEV
jgi:hypothetical protein